MSNTRESEVNNPSKALLSDLPIDVFRTIAEFTQTDKSHKTMGLMSFVNQSLHTLFKPELPNLQIKEALILAADASIDAVHKLLKMLDKNPQLLLKAGNVATRSGLIVENVTVYEFLLGAGDPDLAKQVVAYFAKFEGGEDARMEQYEKYKPYINSMLEQKPYSLTGLIDVIKQASPADVEAALNKQTTGSALDKALDRFRQAVTVKKIAQPQMHYNYQTLISAFELYNMEWDNLYQLSGNNYKKLDLVWRQMIGFLQRGLPAVDRFAFAMSLYDLVENKKPLVRRTEYRYGHGYYPDTGPSDSSLSGLGFDYAVDACGGGRVAGAWRGWTLQPYVEQKLQTCRTYTASAKTEIFPLCDRLK